MQKNMGCILRATFILVMAIVLCSSGNIVYAEDIITKEDILKQEQQLILDNYQALLKRKAESLLEKKGMMLFSKIEDITMLDIMPSTGDIEILILPIEFQDVKIPEVGKNFEERFLKEDSAEEDYEKLSVREIFKRHSYGRLNLIPTILPIYTAPENQAYYEHSMERYEKLIGDALTAYKEYIGGDYARYDSDGDGYIECLEVLSPFCGNPHSIFGSHVADGTGIKIENEDTGVYQFVLNYAAVNSESHVDVHEIGHMMGLPDNYQVRENGKNNVFDPEYHDIMQGGRYFNVYYRYLLDWIDPLIVPYEDNIQEIDLYAVESDTGDDQKTRAVIFTQSEEQLPYSEYYMMEYRNGMEYKNGEVGYPGSGIMVWHCDTALDEYFRYKNSTAYIKAVNKSGTSPYEKKKDMYLKGDVFSEESNPSSNFYNGSRSGVYMKVAEMDEEKAVLQAGFENPDLEPPPMVYISAPSKKYAKAGDQVTFQITSTGGTEFHWSMDKVVTGDIPLPGVYGSHPDGDETKVTATVTLAQGNGTVALRMNQGTVRRGSLLSPEVISEEIIVDNTPPTGEISYSTTEQTFGAVTAKITPNEAVQESAEELTYMFTKNGTHTFTLTDLAGNVTQVDAKVDWIEQIEPLTAAVQYSTKDPVNGNVMAVAVPVRPVQETGLFHIFTENGSHTFSFTDLYGNKGSVTAVVDWIDKTPPTGELIYSTQEPTKDEVTVTVEPSEAVREGAEALTYTFTENGSHTFVFTDLAGNVGTAEAKVDWIDKTLPDIEMQIEQGENTELVLYNRGEPVTAVLTTAEYNAGGELLCLKQEPVTIQTGETVRKPYQYQNENARLKAFLWSDTQNMRPLCEGVSGW